MDNQESEGESAETKPIFRTPEELRKELQSRCDAMKEQLTVAQNICGFIHRQAALEDFEKQVLLQFKELQRLEKEKHLFSKEVLYWIALENLQPGSVIEMKCLMCPTIHIFNNRQSFLNHFHSKHSLFDSEEGKDYNGMKGNKINKGAKGVLIATGLLKSEQSLGLRRSNVGQEIEQSESDGDLKLATFGRIERKGEELLKNWVDQQEEVNPTPPKRKKRKN